MYPGWNRREQVSRPICWEDKPPGAGGGTFGHWARVTTTQTSLPLPSHQPPMLLLAETTWHLLKTVPVEGSSLMLSDKRAPGLHWLLQSLLLWTGVRDLHYCHSKAPSLLLPYPPHSQFNPAPWTGGDSLSSQAGWQPSRTPFPRARAWSAWNPTFPEEQERNSRVVSKGLSARSG